MLYHVYLGCLPKGDENMNEVIRLLQSHRSIRKFKDTPVSESMVKEIIRAAQCAPTSSFTQSYTIIEIKNPEKRKQISILSGEQPYIESCPVFLMFCADLNRLEMVCKLYGENGVGDYTESFIMATVDATLAAQNTMIAAESMGLGGVYIGGGRNNPEGISELLGLPQLVYPVFGMCLGYPAQDPEIKPRLPLEVILKQETYNVTDDLEKIRQYDNEVKEYYMKRTKGKVDYTWTQQLSEKIQSETRAHMQEFLLQRGFIRK